MCPFVRARRGSRPRLFLSSVVLSCAALCAAAPALAARTVTAVQVRTEAQGAVIAISTSDAGKPEINSFVLSEPPRLVFDFADTVLDPELPDAVPVESPRFNQIRLGQFSIEPEVARLVVDLSRGNPPVTWELVPGERKGEALLLLHDPDVTMLSEPAVSRSEGAVVVRVPGAGGLECSVGEAGDPPRVYVDLTGAALAEPMALECEHEPLRRIRGGAQEPVEGRPVARIVLEFSDRQAYAVYPEGADLVIATGPHAWALPLPKYEGSGKLRGKKIVVDPGHGGDDIGAPASFGPPLRGPYEKDIVLDIGRRLAQLLEAEGADVTMTRSDDTCVSLHERAAVANRLRADALVSIHCNSFDRPNTLSGTSVYYDHRHSMRFAELVHEELIAALGTESKGVRNANFAVIRRAKGPGVLVEAAYINHDEDRERLVHPEFRERAARAILRGLTRFLCEGSG